jgi:RNA polymerase sigma-54 factor
VAKLGVKGTLRQFGGVKLARLLEMSDRELGVMASKLEAKPLYAKLVASGAVRRAPFSKAFFATRKFAGLSLAARDSGMGELIHGGSDLISLIKKVGQKDFENCFLSGERMSDAERTRRTGLSVKDVKQLRAFVNRMYIKEEFEEAAPAAPVKMYSTVAGVDIKEGAAVLKFFHRDIWQGTYHVDSQSLERFLKEESPEDRERARKFLSRLAFVDRRKTTLFKVLQRLLQAQAAYLISGDPADLQALTQKDVAAAIESDPSVINRLVANKAIEAPWGVDIPLKTLMPSAKSLTLGIVSELARKTPGMSDEKLRSELAKRFNIHLSRRSIAQYRKECGVGGRGKR